MEDGQVLRQDSKTGIEGLLLSIGRARTRNSHLNRKSDADYIDIRPLTSELGFTWSQQCPWSQLKPFVLFGNLPIPVWNFLNEGLM
jgi:hypothetical protein